MAPFSLSSEWMDIISHDLGDKSAYEAWHNLQYIPHGIYCSITLDLKPLTTLFLNNNLILAANNSMSNPSMEKHIDPKLLPQCIFHPQLISGQRSKGSNTSW